MIIQADILKWAEIYDGPLFHALLCDPPYHLVEIGRSLQMSGGSIDQRTGRSRSNSRRMSKGFMGRDWDGLDENGQGIAFRPETWAALARHLHPGAFGMAFASTKGYHRMACAIEDAGLIIHPMLVYAFGSGFPKATRIDVQIDRRAGAERKVVGKRKHQPKFDAAGHGYREKDNGYNSKDRESFDVTAPATELARAWEGHRYGGQVMKPALEPICVFQKPYTGRPVDCITRTGAGAINIEGGRVGTIKDVPASPRRAAQNQTYGDLSNDPGTGSGWDSNMGRWPANLLLDEHASVALDAQSGVSESRRSDRGLQVSGAHGELAQGTGRVKEGTNTERGHSDTGGASRFFHQSDWAYEVEERIAGADPVRYCAKAHKAEREGGLDPLQIKLMGIMEIEGAEPQRAALSDRKCVNCGGWYPKARRQRVRPNSTCTCDAPMWSDEYFPETNVDDGRQTPIDNAYLRGETKRRNTHPTIKPISLTRYLATLLLPPDLYAPRRILVPFAGAGSEAIGAMLAGWEEVIGVELEAQHVAIAQARMAFWRALRYRLLDPSSSLDIDLDQTDPDQPTLWDLGADDAA